MAQRVGAARRSLDRLLEGVGRAAKPVLRAMSRRAVLPIEGVRALPGLGSRVEVHFDEHGVPHIRARTDADAFRVLGFCHARDRWFQMDILRRVLRGRLSEVVGERPLGAMALPPFGKEATTIGADHLMRVLDLLPAARRVWAQGKEDGRALLLSYAEGVNACLKLLRRRRPVEHRLLRLPLRRWSPVDSILVAKGMALGLSFKWRAAPVFTAIAGALEDRPAHLAQMLPRVPGEGAFAIARCVASGLEEALEFLPMQAPLVGSNAWLIGRGRSASAKPIVSSDPHLELSLPSIWYLASMSGRTYQAVGATLPGLPGVVVGRTPTVAWGLTNGMLDDCDLWLESLDEKGERYRLDDDWRDLEIERQEIPRRGASPPPIDVRRTHRGPLLSDAFPHYDGPAISMRMALHEPSGDLEAFLGIGRARTAGEAIAASHSYGSPAQNLLVADTEGEAAWRLMGRLPLRTHDVHPALPRDGTDSGTDWTGFAPAPSMPGFVLDPDDQLVSSNQPPVEGSYPYYLSHLYEPDYRAERIGQQLSGRSDFEAGDMWSLMGDCVNPAVKRFRESILEPHADAVRTLRPTLGPLLDRLLTWDGHEHKDARGALPWHLTYHHLARRTFSSELGEELTLHWMGLINLVDAALFRAFEHEDSLWAPPEERARLLTEAMEDAAREIQRRGLDLDAPWGALHTLYLKHPAGSAPGLATTFNRGPFPMDGGPYSVCSGQYLHRRPGPMLVGQSFRQVVDMADPEAGRMITFGGQSGHLGSPHYDDLTPLWLDGKTLPMRLASLPEKATVLSLVPG